MSTANIQRTKRFRWNSKNSLYNYFHKYYGINQETIDKEISNSRKSLKPRQGKAPRSVELWQKVGTILEKNNDVVQELPEEKLDYGISDLKISPVRITSVLIFDIGIASMFLALQYGIGIFFSYRSLSQNETANSDSFIEYN